MPLTGEAKKEHNRLAYLKKKEIKQYTDSDKADTYPPGEFFTVADLYKIFNGADWKAEDEDSEYLNKKKRFINVSGLEVIDKNGILAKRTFEEWIQIRRDHRADEWLFWHMMTLDEGRWYEKVHRPLVNFFVKKDNTTLPPNYTQDELNQWLLKQDTQHDRLLLYQRGSRKSSGNLLDGIHWIVNAPDLVVLFVTATKALGRKFVKRVRSYFTIRSYKNPTQFQRIYPELCFAEGQGGDSHEYICPIRHLNLTNPTVSYSSMESSTAGVRCHILKFDDAVDEENYLTVDSRIDIREKADATCELVIRPYGYVDAIGTRYTDGHPTDTEDGPVPDLYGEMIRRNNESDDKDLKILIGKAWTVLPHAEGKGIKDLTEKDVEVLFPEEASFKVLRKKLLQNENLFRSNQLNEPAMVSDEDFYHNNFTEELIRSCCMDASWLPKKGFKAIIWDPASTPGKRSDYTAGTVFLVETETEKESVAWMIDATYDHFSSTEMCKQIVALNKKWVADYVGVEELIVTSTDTFRQEIQRQKYIQGTGDFFIDFFPANREAKAKENRIKALEILMSTGRFKILVGPGTNASFYIDEFIKQAIGFTGHHTRKGHKRGRKDDLIDSASYIAKFLPDKSALSSEQKEAEEVKRKKQIDDRRYQAYFSGVMGSPAGLGSQFITRDGDNKRDSAQPEPEPDQTNPIYRAISLLKNYKK